MLNMDFGLTVITDTRAIAWQPSPMAGVWRKPLAREDAERGHATSIVRYDPGASFREHGHPAGEEILVLAGTFSDESGDYGPGTYFRNPQGFRHQPFSHEGCLILVKLHQFQAADIDHVVLDTALIETVAEQDGVARLDLHGYGTERVAMLRLSESAVLPSEALSQGAELYVLEGELKGEGAYCPEGTWARFPRGTQGTLRATTASLVWLKTGHLEQVE